MQGRDKLTYRIALRVLLGVLLLCGASGAAAVYVGPAAVMGPSFADTHGVDCRTVATMKSNDGHGLVVRQFVAANADDDLVRFRTALRVAEALRNQQTPHLVQVSVMDTDGPSSLSRMRGRAIGAKITLIGNPATDVEAQAGTVSGFSVWGPAGPDGSFYGIRLDAMPEDIEKMLSELEKISGCSEPSVSAPSVTDDSG
ncbi:hypothetical protein [Pseudorhizobium flavum]|uniref:Uncharacterized protein n=1 Tax=Pseudorhizobium flavum TaxID=1335061 RepID=A0A7W9Z1E6_9HYPH|nr:hypothetical protein [Pseudorhizobium flavum]MBB6182167.1 hypothetical protein [Pseudorhizobium flavum]CAD6630442.1 hypothetical protein RFYW14_04266 [Pseudorhizobium flavum]